MKLPVRRIILNLIDDGSEEAMVFSVPVRGEPHPTFEVTVLGMVLPTHVEAWAVELMMGCLARTQPITRDQPSNVDPPTIVVDVVVPKYKLDGSAVRRIRAAKKSENPNAAPDIYPNLVGDRPDPKTGV